MIDFIAIALSLLENERNDEIDGKEFYDEEDLIDKVENNEVIDLQYEEDQKIALKLQNIERGRNRNMNPKEMTEFERVC